jgi:hypothetical protein
MGDLIGHKISVGKSIQTNEPGEFDIINKRLVIIILIYIPCTFTA